MRRLAPALVIVCFLAFAGAASAAKPFNLGTGRNPDVVVDAAGTGHFVWDQPAPAGADPLRYCQVPRGGTACAVSKTFAPPLEAIGRSSYVFIGGGSVAMVTHRCCGPEEGNYLYRSTDGGQTFGEPELIGNIDFDEAAVLGPGDAISGATRSDYLRMPIGPGPAQNPVELEPGFAVPTHAGLGIFNGEIPVLVHADGDDTTFNRYDGTGNVNTEANWIGPTKVTPPGDQPELANGSKGLVMLYMVDVAGGGRRLVARKFNGTAFGLPVGVSEKADPIEHDLFAAPGTGMFHSVWNDNRSPNRLKWRTSPDGIGWGKTAVIAKGAAVDAGFAYQVAAAADRQGFATWDELDNTGRVRAIALDTLGGKQVDSVTVAGKQYRFFAPDACVASGQQALLRVTQKQLNKVPKSKRKKIDQVKFLFDAAAKTDEKSPWQKSFSTAGFASKSTHQATAKVRLKPVDGDGDNTTKTLTGTFKIC